MCQLRAIDGWIQMLTSASSQVKRAVASVIVRTLWGHTSASARQRQWATPTLKMVVFHIRLQRVGAYILYGCTLLHSSSIRMLSCLSYVLVVISQVDWCYEMCVKVI